MKLKKILIIILITISTANWSYAQKTLKRTDTLDLNKVSAEELSSKFKNGFEANTIIFQDGSIIQIGSELIFGNPSNPMNVNYNIYNGIKIADTEIDYTYLMFGKYSFMNAMADSYFGSGYSKTEIIVDRMRVYRRKKTIKIIADFTNKDGTNISIGKYGSILNLEETLSNGEIINPNAPMTRDEAIAKLKESKELFDLELMTQEEYDKIKEELSPIIKGNN